MSQANRGKQLEDLIEHTNRLYKQKGQALIDKVPTPWSVSYDRRTKRVFKAFPQKKGTVDFIGISHGTSIAFDAKSTNIRTSFPLSNIQDHQVEYLKKHQDQGGKSFFVIEFEKLGETFILTFDQLHEWWKQSKNGGRKSIPYSFFNTECDRIKSRNGIPLDYLSGVIRNE